MEYFFGIFFQAMNAARLKTLLCTCLLLLTATVATAAEQVVIQLKWLNQFQFAGYYAALEQGFFAEEGLDVVLKERDMSRDNIEQVLQGEAQYGVADSILLVHYAQGRDLVLVAPILQHSPNVLMSLRASGIRSPRDLVGRRLSLYSNDTDGLAIMAMLAEQRVLNDGLIPQSWSKNRLQRLISGEVEAVAVYSTNEPFLLREMGHQVDILDPKHYGMDFYGDIFFTSGEEARQNPERVERMRRAVIRGWHHALDNKEALVELILQRYNTQGKSRSALMNEALALEPLISRHTQELGRLDPGRIDYMMNLLTRYQLARPGDSGVDQLVFESARLNLLNLTEAEQAYLRANPRLKVAVRTNWPPFEYQDAQGVQQGMTFHYLKLLSERLGVEFDMDTVASRSGLLQSVAAGSHDVLPAIVATPERQRFLQFTQPYMRSPMVIVTGQQVDYLADMTPLHSRQVAVVQDSVADELLRNNHPLIPLVPVTSAVEGLQSVARGEVFAFVDSLAAVSYLIRAEGLANLKVSGQTAYSFSLGMAVSHEQPLLASILDKALASISHQEHEAIYDRWVSVLVDHDLSWHKVLPVMLGLLALLLLLGFYSLYLIRLNRRIRLVNTRLQRAERELLEKNRQLEQVSVTDKLTGIYNRHHLDEVLAQQLALASRHQRPLSVVLFDLDHFKVVNDTYGHQVGDKVLQAFAGLVRQLTRSSDVFGRWGGEEFLLVCPETSLQEATAVAEKIRVALEHLPFETGLQQHLSAGVMALAPGMTLDQLLSGVDQQLYLAKAQGRNRVVA